MLVGAMAQAVFGAIEPKNFIFIVPDGLAPASQTLLRTYLAMTEGSSTLRAPDIEALPVDVAVCCPPLLFPSYLDPYYRQRSTHPLN